MSDPDRSRVYEAEWQLRTLLESAQATIAGARLVMPVERRFANLDDIQRYCDKVLALNWVRAGWPQAGAVTVVRSKTINRAKCGRGVMHVNDSYEGKWALRESVILHELSHHLEPFDAHGPKFRAAFHHLVTEIVGPEAGFALGVLFAESGLVLTA